jgi:hypothetical protein
MRQSMQRLELRLLIGKKIEILEDVLNLRKMNIHMGIN